ncbi:phosphotransferase enzyme domain containing protein [Acanthamoeba castellanii str. Neff]|uniref:Phosphotransferase enzyme domain containing protein n=1 Tax=Acanthamoeba castellanii (strain ATCC 30010 / Neff) TaxID=1257118 RepID=L8H0B8_ACACF|nr:phosphotransferase enzyme domain containing protein [Acanthamoeba castellanii str. Neff]ELR17826.1 phosphotransferase enzyme domain containing protein [Acanthamoeba castellanii str. Neff]
MKETSLSAQLEELKATMARVTPEAVGRVLAPLGLVCRKLTHFADSLGVINPIFFVQAAPPPGEEKEEEAEAVELVLRVSNPHPFWRGRKTEHEVAVMEFVRAHGRPDVLPVPRVIAYASDAAQSPLGTEFVLMEKAPGQNLDDLWPTLDAEAKRDYMVQLVQFMAELRRISAFLPNRGMGGFNREMELVELVQDGPLIGPFTSFADSVEHHLRWAMEMIGDTLASRQELVHELRELVPEWMDTVLARYRALASSCEEEEFGLCHNDLNFSNLLVDHERRKIVAVLDWEKSKCSVYDDELRGVEESIEDEEPTLAALHEAMAALGVSRPSGYDHRKALIKPDAKDLADEELDYFVAHAQDAKEALVAQLAAFKSTLVPQPTMGNVVE